MVNRPKATTQGETTNTMARQNLTLSLGSEPETFIKMSRREKMKRKKRKRSPHSNYHPSKDIQH